MRNGMIVEPADNVVIAIESIGKGETVTYLCAGQEQSLTALEDITIYHKLAARDIRKGEHVHVHNVEGHREDLEAKA